MTIPRPTIRRRRAQKGQVLILVLTLLAMGVLLATSLLSLQSRVYRQSKQLFSRQQAIYLAEAGLDIGTSEYNKSASYTGGTVSLAGGTVTISITAGSIANEKSLVSTATYNKITKQLKAKLTAQSNGTAVAFHFALQSGSKGFSVGNGSQISGNVYSNQNINGSPGSSITGDASAVGTISGITVSGQKKTGQPVEPLPTFDNAFWKQKALEGTTVTGPYTPANNSSIGPLYVNGDLNIGQSTSIRIAGAVYATGKITFGNGPTLTVDNSLGNNGTMLIAEKEISFGNAITVTNNNQGGWLLMVSLSTSDSAIAIKNNAVSINAPLYALNGKINIANNAHAVAFAAAGVVIGNNTVVTYDQGLANASFSSGPSGGWLIQRGSLYGY